MIRFLLTLILAAPLICLFGACSSGKPTENITESKLEISDHPAGTYQIITAEQAKSKMDEAEAYILLDVRTAEEFRQSHIDGAILIPDYELYDRAEAELPDKDALILVYCRSGRRSAVAAKVLIELGYTNVIDFGGIIDWPYDTVSE